MSNITLIRQVLTPQPYLVPTLRRKPADTGVKEISLFNDRYIARYIIIVLFIYMGELSSEIKFTGTCWQFVIQNQGIGILW